MNPRREADPQATGSVTRLKIGLQVALTALLAAVAALLLSWLAERPGLRIRADLTAARENTLGPASLAVLEKLPGEVAIDVFFTPMEGSLGSVGSEAQERTLRVLVSLRESSGGRVTTRLHDLVSQTGMAAAKARLQELSLRQVEPGGIVVVSMGKRHSVQRLQGDLADLDPGDPRGEQGVPRPPRQVFFRAEEALVSALLKVGLGDQLQVLFTIGHGERDLDDTGLNGLSELRRGLEGDGFGVDRWDGGGGGRIPDRCAVLAIIGPEQPFTTAEVEAIEEFVESGGRLVAAPGRGLSEAGIQGDRSLPALLLRWGIKIATEGIVAEPRATTGKPLYESPQCAEVRVGSESLSALSPVTEPLKRAHRYAEMPFSRSLERSTPPPGAAVLTLLTSDATAWRDVPNSPTPTGHDWKPAPTEARGPFALGMTSLFHPPRLSNARHVRSQEFQSESRVLCLGSADAFANPVYDVNGALILNGFDWVVAREFGVHVEPHSRVARRLDVASGSVLARVHLVSVILLPGVCLVLGCLTAWWRRRR
jgi:hypothetical protein